MQEGSNGASPFVGSDTTIMDKVKKTYANCVLIDDTNGFDDRMITPFLERLGTIGLDGKDIDLSNIYGYIALYDSLKVFAIAGRKVLNSTGQFSSIIDGRLMWNAMRRTKIQGLFLPFYGSYPFQPLQMRCISLHKMFDRKFDFQGMVASTGVSSGTVMLDDLAERLPFYSAFFVDKNRNQVTPIANMAPMLMGNCDGLKTGTGCFQIVSVVYYYEDTAQRRMKDTEKEYRNLFLSW
ncbi:unnamed protein product [Strongylus vulgaris]|uniref:Receptor ligand binding region domain-containing protein n=1 Tax=Strongylus vulgaris TaxID=40348 RepID=A0A3P7I4X2_STRVU|nr:unnamed protein product [Strongylus vulgaris]